MSDESKRTDEPAETEGATAPEGVELSDDQLDAVSGGIGEAAQLKPAAGVSLNPGRLKTWGDPHEFGG